jgi:hypothetical protein
LLERGDGVVDVGDGAVDLRTRLLVRLSNENLSIYLRDWKNKTI